MPAELERTDRWHNLVSAGMAVFVSHFYCGRPRWAASGLTLCFQRARSCWWSPSQIASVPTSLDLFAGCVCALSETPSFGELHAGFHLFLRGPWRYGPCQMSDTEKPDEMAPLIDAVQQGDRGALDRLLRQLMPWIRRKARGLVSRTAPMGVSSLTQETALRFSRSVEKMRAGDSPAVKALLRRIMHNTAVSAHRAASRTKRDAERRLLNELVQDPPNDTAAQLHEHEQHQQLHDAIAQLPERQRLVITLLLDEVSIDQVASQLSCSAGAVSMLQQRAKAQLAKLLRHDPEPKLH